MEHFVGYHNADQWGPYFTNARRRNAKECSFFTAKPFRSETLIGHKLWAIEGSGSPRRYKLVSSGFISNVSSEKRPPQYRQPGRRDGIEVYFSVEAWRDPIEVTDLGWFRQLLQQQQSFRYGFSKISDDEITNALEELWSGGHGHSSSSALVDIEQLQQDKSISKTTRYALIEARLGQGQFRRDLERRWGDACAVTGCGLSAVLRASHIKLWKLSSNAERLDPTNGLLLVAHIDALFDSGLISFGDDGRMIVSMEISQKDRRFFQVPASLRLKLATNEKRFLRHHRSEIFRDRAK